MNKFWYIALAIIFTIFIGFAIYLFPNLMVYKHNVSDIVDSSFDEIWLIDKSSYDFCANDSTISEVFFPVFLYSMSDWQNIFQKIYYIIDSPKSYWIFDVNFDIKKNNFIKNIEKIGFKKISKEQFVNSSNEIINIHYYPLVLYSINQNFLPSFNGSIEFSENHFKFSPNYKLHLAINSSNVEKLNNNWSKYNVKFIDINNDIYYFDIDKQNELWLFYQVFPKQKNNFIYSDDFFKPQIIPSQVEQFFTIYKSENQTIADALRVHLGEITNKVFVNTDFSDWINNNILLSIIDDNLLLIMQCEDTTNTTNFLNNNLEVVNKNLWKSNENIFNQAEKNLSLSYFYLKDTLLYYFNDLNLFNFLSKNMFTFIHNEVYKNVSLYISSKINELAFFKNINSPLPYNKEKQGNLWLINSANINSQRLFIWDENSYDFQKVDILNLYNKICNNCFNFKLVSSPTNLYITYLQDKKFFIEGLVKKSFVEIKLPDKDIIDVLIMNDNSENLLLVSNNGLFMYDMAGSLKWKKENEIFGYALFKYEDGLQRLFYLSNDGILHNNNSNGETPEGWKPIKASFNAKVTYANWDSKEYICVADKNIFTLYNRRGEKQAQYKFSNSLKDLYFSTKNSVLYLIDDKGKLFELKEPKQGSIIGKNTGFNNFTFVGDTLVMWNRNTIAWIDKDNGRVVRDFKYNGTILLKNNKLSWSKKYAPIIIKSNNDQYVVLSAKMQILYNISSIQSLDALYWDNSLILLQSIDEKIDIIKR
jgi:hypothetical protein